MEEFVGERFVAAAAGVVGWIENCRLEYYIHRDVLFFFERLRLEYLPLFIFTRQIITHLMNDALDHHVYRARLRRSALALALTTATARSKPRLHSLKASRS